MITKITECDGFNKFLLNPDYQVVSFQVNKDEDDTLTIYLMGKGRIPIVGVFTERRYMNHLYLEEFCDKQQFMGYQRVFNQLYFLSMNVDFYVNNPYHIKKLISSCNTQTVSIKAEIGLYYKQLEELLNTITANEERISNIEYLCSVINNCFSR